MSMLETLPNRNGEKGFLERRNVIYRTEGRNDKT
jgi:hypothetical protein